VRRSHEIDGQLDFWVLKSSKIREIRHGESVVGWATPNLHARGRTVSVGSSY
jgi:hypothetical protein